MKGIKIWGVIGDFKWCHYHLCLCVWDHCSLIPESIGVPKNNAQKRLIQTIQSAHCEQGLLRAKATHISITPVNLRCLRVPGSYSAVDEATHSPMKFGFDTNFVAQNSPKVSITDRVQGQTQLPGSNDVEQKEIDWQSLHRLRGVTFRYTKENKKLNHHKKTMK